MTTTNKTCAQLRQHAANRFLSANKQELSDTAVEYLRAAAIVGPVQKVPENCGSGHCSCIECFKDKP